MELMNAWVIVAGILAFGILVALVLFLKKRQKDEFASGIKAANTGRIKNSKVYLDLMRTYRIIACCMAASLFAGVVSALFLVARPYKNSDVYTGIKKRDIILCLDVSYSLYDLNSEIIDYYKGVVRGLSGDRIGVSIFNTSTVTYVPLTDDYDYVAEKLDELLVYFELQKELYEEIYDHYDYVEEMPAEVEQRYYDLKDELAYYDAGTLYNNNLRGSSLIGEGLGTALYSFPYLGDSERTRVIIMSTDNQLNNLEKEVMNLKEAAEACRKNKVTVFGIFPDEDNFYQPEFYSYATCKNEFASAVEKTGGLLYVRTPDLPVSAIVQNIQKQEVMAVNMIISKEIQDLPMKPFVALLLSVTVFFGLGLLMQGQRGVFR